MTKREIALQKIEDVKQALVEAYSDLEAAKNTGPYDWKGEIDIYTVYGCGKIAEVDEDDAHGRYNFYFSTRIEADKFAKKLKIMSVLNNLKKSLGDTTEADGVSDCYHLEYECKSGNWAIDWSRSYCNGAIVFSKHNIEKIVDYMNEHHPEGWS